VILENLLQGRRAAVGSAPLVVGELGDNTVLDEVFQAWPIDAVMHLPSFIQVGESVAKPGTQSMRSLTLRSVRRAVESPSTMPHEGPAIPPFS